MLHVCRLIAVEHIKMTKAVIQSRAQRFARLSLRVFRGFTTDLLPVDNL